MSSLTTRDVVIMTSLYAPRVKDKSPGLLTVPQHTPLTVTLTPVYSNRDSDVPHHNHLNVSGHFHTPVCTVTFNVGRKEGKKVENKETGICESVCLLFIRKEKNFNDFWEDVFGHFS